MLAPMIWRWPRVPEYAEGLRPGQARAAVLWADADWQALGLEAALMPPRPRYALSGLTAMLDPGQGYGDGMHATAVIDPTAEIGADVAVGRSVIGRGCEDRRRQCDRAAMLCRCRMPCWVRRLSARTGQHRCRARRAHFDRPTRSADWRRWVFLCHAGQVRVERGNHARKPRRSGRHRSQVWVRIHSLGAVTSAMMLRWGECLTIDSGTIRPTRDRRWHQDRQSGSDRPQL